MEDIYMICHRCKTTFPVEKHGNCPKCGGILTVEYTTEYLKTAVSKMSEREKKSMWDYREVLPLTSCAKEVSFGEGNTPLRKSMEIGEELGIKQLYFKDETKNPTGSFKDRSVSVCVSMAKKFQSPGIVVSSSGNGGASTSAYGTKGGVDTIIFVPEKTPVGKVAQAIAYGGKIIKVRGDFSNSYRAASDMAARKAYMNVTTTFLSPYGLEGYKIIAYELMDQLGKAPDYILIPVGAGPVLYGIYKGFEEMRRAGRCSAIPKLVCVQASGCAPIAKAWREKRRVTGCSNPRTVASAISDPLKGYEQDGDITVEAITDSKGCAVILDDEEILEAGRILARKEGLYVEPASAAAVAALFKLEKDGVIQEADCCVVLLTGHGLKDSPAYIPANMEVPVIDSIDDL